MTDLAHHHRVRTVFDGLLDELATSWPASDIAYVREEVSYAEYGDALENLIVLGLRNGHGFDLKQAREIEALAAAMHIEDSPVLTQLRKLAGEQR